MKKTSFFLVSGLIIAALNFNGCAALNKQMSDNSNDSQKIAASSTVGIVDTQRILRSSKLSALLDKTRQELEGLKQSVQAEMLEKSRLLEEARNNNVSQEELAAMEQKFRHEIETKQRETQNLYLTKQKEIELLSKDFEKDVKAIIDKIATDKKIGIVIDKQAVLAGVNDITDDVLKEVEKLDFEKKEENK